MATGYLKITAPSVILNGIPIAIVPNSFMFTLGRGKISKKTQSLGGLATEVVSGRDASTQLSVFKFKTYNTPQNMNLIVDLQELVDGIVIQFADTESSLTGISRFGGITNDPDYNLGVDGETEIEITGSPVKLSGV